MRDIILAFFLGVAFANSLHSGTESVNDGGVGWVFQLIVFPLVALVGIVSLLLEHRKRVSTHGRHPNSHDTD